MSTYCTVGILANDDVDILKLLTKFALENYKAREAVKIDFRQYSIDAGMNDVRAIIRNGGKVITFCCRYQREVAITEGKIRRFAKSHNLQLVDVKLGMN